MAEVFEGARKRFRQVVKDELEVDVHPTVHFTADAVKGAIRWAKRRGLTYERDGELGGLLMAWLSSGVEPDLVDIDLDESPDADVDVQP